MFLIWLVILVVYGLLHGFAGEIHPLFWWLLMIFFLQDARIWYVRELIDQNQEER